VGLPSGRNNQQNTLHCVFAFQKRQSGSSDNVQAITIIQYVMQSMGFFEEEPPRF
jgi:hypothetical protein